MKKLSILFLCVVCLLTGCSESCNCDTNIQRIGTYGDGTFIVSEFIDTETGVHYLVGKYGGTSVMYNSDGTIKVD